MQIDPIGPRPEGYSTQLVSSLRPEQRADLAMVSIHRQLFEIVEANIPGLSADIDIEYLHDFRVALRKIRTALACLPKVLPRYPTLDFKEELRWMFRATGDLRDLDVFLATITREADTESDAFVELLPMLDYFMARRGRLQEDVQRLLKSERVQTLLIRWRQYLSSGFSQLPPARHSASPILKVARKALLQRWRRVLTRATQVSAESPDVDLHQLRVEIKKLRYLLVFFGELFPNGSGEALLFLKRLQDALGGCSDVRVQIDTLERFLSLSVPDTKCPEKTTRRIQILVDRLEAHGSKSRQEVLDQLHQVDSGPLFKLMDAALSRR